MAFLEVKNITKRFDKNEVLKGVDLTLEKGEVLSIIGSSGSGKTTLLRCLNFLETADAGTISVDGKCIFDASDIRKYSSAEIREKRLSFGLVFQSFNLFPQYTVKENLTLAPRLRAKEKAKSEKFSSSELKNMYSEIDKKASELLLSVGLSDKENAYPCEISGGQQQRVSIARALAGNPSVILADEPTGALDSRTSKEVIDFFKQLNESGNTIVLITHDNSIAAQAKRVIRIQDGKITYDGEAMGDEIIRSTVHFADMQRKENGI